MIPPKKYFYEFIRFFANKINIHFDDLGQTLENYDEISSASKKIPDLMEKDNSLKTQIQDVKNSILEP